MQPELTIKTKHLSALMLLLGIGIVSWHSIASAQKANPAQKSNNGPFRYGDISISNYATIGGTFSTSVQVTGPNTVVDAVDAKTPNAKSQIRASNIIAKLSEKKDKSEVERVDAEGNLRFSSVRPQPDGTVQTVDGTGSKAIYFKSENRIVILGPVTYHAVTKAKDGLLLQSVIGTAGKAAYDEDKKILRLEGGVNAKVESPNLRKPGELNDVTDLTLELGSEPIKFHIDGGNVIAYPKETGKKS